MVKRKIGFEAPYSVDQMVSWLVYPLLVASYFLVVGLALAHLPFQKHLIWVNCFFTAVFLAAYFAVENIDPADFFEKPHIRVICFPRAADKTRYCAQCAKSVVGLDHHCTWLNTCIGIQNYVPFISLISIGFAQMSLQAAIGVLALLPKYHDGEHAEWTTDRLGGESFVYYILIGAYLLGSISLLIAFGVLLSFHLYLLLFVRVGTYEWMMGGRVEYGGTSISTKDEKIEQENKKKKERFEAARQAAMKDAANSDIESRGRMGAGSDRGRGYDRLTVFPAGDKELEMTTGEPVSTDIAVPEVFSIAAAQSI